MERKQITEISVAIPIYDEQENILELYDRLSKILENICTTEGFSKESYEIILVDDGSRDSSWNMIRDLHERDSRVKGLRLSRNFGHHYAITAGLDFSRGNAVILLDGDLQDPPEEILPLHEKYKEGYDIVYAIRGSRYDNIFKKIFASMFWRCISTLSKVTIPRNQAMLRILSREMVNTLKEMKEYSRFIHGMMAWAGFDTSTIEITHCARKKGASKYSVTKQIGLALSAITSSSLMPLRFAIALGLAASAASAFMGLYLVYRKLVYGFPVYGWASIIATILLMGGLQLLVLGVFGEYLGKIFQQSQRRPLYIVRETLS